MVDYALRRMSRSAAVMMMDDGMRRLVEDGIRNSDDVAENVYNAPRFGYGFRYVLTDIYLGKFSGLRLLQCVFL